MPDKRLISFSSISMQSIWWLCWAWQIYILRYRYQNWRSCSTLMYLCIHVHITLSSGNVLTCKTLEESGYLTVALLRMLIAYLAMVQTNYICILCMARRLSANVTLATSLTGMTRSPIATGNVVWLVDLWMLNRNTPVQMLGLLYMKLGSLHSVDVFKSQKQTKWYDYTHTFSL